MSWFEIDGRPECIGVTVISHAAGSGKHVLNASLLRAIPIADFIAEDRSIMAPPVDATGGMRRSAAERLRVAAQIYQRAVRERRPPTKAVAEHFGISSGGASNLVARARTAGLLPPTSPGKAAG